MILAFLLCLQLTGGQYMSPKTALSSENFHHKTFDINDLFFKSYLRELFIEIFRQYPIFVLKSKMILK